MKAEVFKNNWICPMMHNRCIWNVFPGHIKNNYSVVLPRCRTAFLWPNLLQCIKVAQCLPHSPTMSVFTNAWCWNVQHGCRQRTLECHQRLYTFEGGKWHTSPVYFQVKQYLLWINNTSKPNSFSAEWQSQSQNIFTLIWIDWCKG